MNVAPTLRRFQRDDSFVRAVVGPFGSGKSTACVLELLRRAGQQKPGPDGVRRTRFVVVRNTYGQLRDTTLKTFEQWAPPEIGHLEKQAFTWMGRWSDGEHTVETEILFRALDRPEDITKLLSLELTGAYVNEAREIPKAILDGLEGRVGRYPAQRDGGPSWFGIWLDTNPWHTGHWGHRLFSRDRPEGYALFEQPGGRAPEAENLDNLPDGYYDRLCHGKDSEWIRCYVDGLYPSSDVGSIFGAWIASLEARGALREFDHPRDGVLTAWDLGRADSTAIWFFRFNEERGLDVLDHHEATGKGLSYFFDVIEGRGYRYDQHWLPPDAKQRTLATEASVYDQCAARWTSKVSIVPALSVKDGIAAARWLLEQPIRMHVRCDEPSQALGWSGVEALREYRFEWDEADKCFGVNPLHNWASHSADGFRYAALVAKHSERMTRPPPERKPVTFEPPKFTIGDLIKDKQRENRRRREA